MTALSLAARSVATLTIEAGRCGASRLVRGRLPDRGSRITVPWLENAMALPAGTLRSVTVVTEDSGTAGRVRLALDAPEGAAVPSHVFLKLTPRSFAQQLLMNVVGLGRREVLFYQAAAPQVPMRVPRCHGAHLDRALGRNVIVLEDLSGTATFRDVRENVSLAEAQAVVDAMADLHAAFWESPRLGGELAELGPLRARSAVVASLGAVAVKRGLSKPATHIADLVPPELVGASSILYDHVAEADAFWAAQPQTLTHGDPHLGNLFFEDDRPGFLDWQVATIGPGIRDVVYFVVSAMTAEAARAHERALVERYAARLELAGVKTDIETQWTYYRALASEIYVAAMTTAAAGDRMQARDVSRAGVERAVEAVRALDTFEVLAGLIGLRR